MSNVVHGFVANEEMDKVLKNINAVLKDDGKLIIIDYLPIPIVAFGAPALSTKRAMVRMAMIRRQFLELNWLNNRIKSRRMFFILSSVVARLF